MTAQDSAIDAGRIAVPGPSAATAPDGSPAPTPSPAAAVSPAPQAATVPGPRVRRGLFLAALGVLCFSLTFPATAWALEGFGPWTTTALRAVIGAVLAGVALLVRRAPVPERRHRAGIAVAASGVVIGFPLLTTLALQTSTTSHAAVVVGLLPLTTAVYSSLRTGSRPSPVFWTAAVAGAAVVIVFTLLQNGGAPTTGDLYLLGALLICAAGYAEGGRLARELGGLRVIGWALLGSLPLALPGAALALWLEGDVRLTGHAVGGLLWLGAGSLLLGVLFWYTGMGLAGVARASQVQLAQPLLTLVWAVLLLGEEPAPAAPVAAVAVLVCIVVVQRSRT